MGRRLRGTRRRGLDPYAEVTIEPRKYSLIFGITQLVFGAISIVFGIALIPMEAWGHQGGVGIWTGLVFVIVGAVEINANKRRILKNIVYCSAACLCAVILGFIVFVFQCVATYFNSIPYTDTRIKFSLTPSARYLRWRFIFDSCVLGMNVLLMINGLVQVVCGLIQFYLCSLTISRYERLIEKAERKRGHVNRAAQVETSPSPKRCPVEHKPDQRQGYIHSISSQV